MKFKVTDENKGHSNPFLHVTIIVVATKLEALISQNGIQKTSLGQLWQMLVLVTNIVTCKMFIDYGKTN